MVENIEYKPLNCWDVYGSEQDRKIVEELGSEYIELLSSCKTEREVVSRVAEELQKAAFSDSGQGDKLFFVHRGKAILAARKGRKSLSEGSRVIGAHADSPRIDLKQRPLYQDCGLCLGKTHYYGGIKKYQWLARPLALHGVVAKADGSILDISIGEDPDDPVFCIADLLPHLSQKQMEKKVADAFEAEKLNIAFGLTPADKDEKSKEDKSVKKGVLELLNSRYGFVEEDLISAELQMVPAGPAREVGLDRSMIGGYGQDDRICVYTALKAFLDTDPEPEYTQIIVFWDKEEIGSDGSTGAQSLFFEYCLEELRVKWDSEAAVSRIMYNMKALSSDVSPPIDPDFQDVHEKNNVAYMGHGPVVCKYTGHRGKYGANDAHAEYLGWLRGVLNGAGVPWQTAELGKVDQGGGGTIAKYLAKYGMDIVDFGPCVWSMHSPFEISSKIDLLATIRAYQAFLGA